jgi:hypothetical protein
MDEVEKFPTPRLRARCFYCRPTPDFRMHLIDLLLLVDGKLAWAHVYEEEETTTNELVSGCFRVK